MSRVTKRFVYQRARWNLPTTEKLQSVFQRALLTLDQQDHDQPVTDDSAEATGTWRRLTYQFSDHGCSFGKLAQFTSGMKQETVRKRTGEGEAEGAVAPPEGEEFSAGSLYFCIEDDHVIVAQSPSLRIGQLESFLNWLLRTRAEVIPAGNFIALESIATREGRGRLGETTPSSVTLARPVDLGVPVPVEGADTSLATQTRTFSANATIAAVESLLGIDDLRQNLPPDALAVGRLRTEIKLSWSAKTGGTRPDEVLKALGRVALRALDEDPSVDVKIQTPKGELTRKQLSLAKSYSFQLTDGRVPNQKVFDKMFAYLGLLRSGNEIVD